MDIEARADRVGFGRGATIYEPLHYLPVLGRKPGALRNGAPLPQLEASGAGGEGAGAAGRVRGRRAADRGHPVRGRPGGHGGGGVGLRRGARVGRGVRRRGPDILSRRRDPGPPPEVGTPEGLRLALEPEADCARYDLLPEAPDAAR